MGGMGGMGGMERHGSVDGRRAPARPAPGFPGDDTTTDDREETDGASIKPLDDRVVVKVLEAEEKTAGGIVLPDTAKEKPQQRQDRRRRPRRAQRRTARALTCRVKKGDHVFFGKYAGTDVTDRRRGLQDPQAENDVLARIESA